MQIKEWLETHLLKETKRIPISPTAHFCVGGIYVNERMETSLPGLYAAGEVTGGLHGANRLGGNALSEAIVSGKQAGLSATAAQGNIHFSQHGMLIMDHTAMQANELIATISSGTQPPSPIRKELNNLMWEKVGVLRTKEGLNQALQQIKEMDKLDLSRKEAGIVKVLELKNMLLTSEIICRSALFREESRGCHYRMDFPDTDNTNWLTHSQLELEDDIMSLNKLPIK
jgi:succinate dehydrogenase/fumarate reductase flavoprotein subunit